MTARKRQRLFLLLASLVALGGATGMVLSAFRSNLVFFYTPSELRAQPRAVGHDLRIGGLVENHSVVEHGGDIAFRVTDGKADIAVRYRGILPDLFREGQGVVVEGRLAGDGVFAATTVLAKHDARYMPREVVEALKKSGRWREGAAAPPPVSLH